MEELKSLDSREYILVSPLCVAVLVSLLLL